MKIAIVTGANRGIGFELTRQLLDSGYAVHATYRSNMGGLKGVQHAHLTTHRVDVRSDEDVAALMVSVGERVDLLVNNAGVPDGRWSSIAEIDLQETADVFEVNAFSPVLVTQHALPLLANSQAGVVAMMSSLMASIDDCKSGRSYAYMASKTALNMFAISMKNEIEALGASLIILHPGWVETDMGGPHAPLTPQESVKGIVARLNEQNGELSGRFVQYDGIELPW